MQFFVYRNDAQEGPYTAQEIQARLNDGRLLPTDLCWYEGAPDWQPIHRVPPVNAASKDSALVVVQRLPSVVEQFSRTVSRPRPYYADDHERDKRNEGFNPAVSGWICFFVAIGGLVCFSYFWLPIAIVLFFVVFVLSIVALAKGRVASGVIMLCALVIIGPVAGFVAPLIVPGILAARHQAAVHSTPATVPLAPAYADTQDDVPAVTPAPTTPIVPTPAPEAFLADVKYSQQAAVAKYPSLATKSSALNMTFVKRYATWKQNHDPRLDHSDWPERLADDCTANP